METFTVTAPPTDYRENCMKERLKESRSPMKSLQINAV